MLDDGLDLWLHHSTEALRLEWQAICWCISQAQERPMLAGAMVTVGAIILLWYWIV